MDTCRSDGPEAAARIPTDAESTVLQQLSRRIRAALSPEDGMRRVLPYMSLYRFSGEQIAMPETDNLYLYLVVDGSLRLYTPSGIMDYMAGQYSVSKTDAPLSGHVLAFSDAQDFLALSLELTLSEVIACVLELDGALTKQILDSESSDPLVPQSDARIPSCIYRLVSMTDSPVQLGLMEKNIKREIILNLLGGSCGRQFLLSVINIQQAGEIYDANTWIKENFREPFSVEELAKKWNMSVSQFHQKFKSAVGMGPLQCQKRLRLTEARRLMLDENKNTTEAATDVGYESVSQFTREYVKMFGRPPKEDIVSLRAHLKNQAKIP